jgi:hypothetical protein
MIQTATAQSSTPSISGGSSNEIIAEKIRQYRTSYSYDVFPPEKVATKFKADYPRASDVEWETDDNIYEVEFDVRFRDYKAYYDAEGNQLMTVEEIYRSELPAVVKNAAETKYRGYRLDNMNKIRRGTEVFYHIKMELRDTEVELLVRPDGTIVKEKMDY